MTSHLEVAPTRKQTGKDIQRPGNLWKSKRPGPGGVWFWFTDILLAVDADESSQQSVS